MALRPTTPEQVDGHAFLLQRARGAVVGQDITARGDRLRTLTRATGAGVALGAILLAGAAVLGFVRPAPDLADEQLLQVRETGALFVRVGDSWHPTPNLASARLVLGEPATPRAVPQDAMDGEPLGSSVGIPGAPTLLPDESDWPGAVWSVCDVPRSDRTGREVMVLARPGTGPGDGGWEPRAAVLAERDGQGWLLGDGRRTRVDLSDTAVLEVFGLHDWPRVTVSDAMLGLLPEGPPLRRIEVPDAGRAAPHGPEGMRIGEVFAMRTAAERKFFVVLAGGVQEIPELAAELLRVTGPSREDAAVAVLAPAQVSAPRVDELSFPGVPLLRPRPADRGTGLLCAEWVGGGDGDVPPQVSLRTAARPAELTDRPPVALATADGPGPGVDAVALPARGLRVRPLAAGSAEQVGFEQAVISGAGVRHGVAGAESADALGLVGEPLPIPASLLRLLPLGPDLSVAGARVAYDSPQTAPPEQLLTGTDGG